MEWYALTEKIERQQGKVEADVQADNHSDATWQRHNWSLTGLQMKELCNEPRVWVCSGKWETQGNKGSSELPVEAQQGWYLDVSPAKPNLEVWSPETINIINVRSLKPLSYIYVETQFIL